MAEHDEQGDLGRYFEAARARAPRPSPALMDRIAADAEMVQEGFGAARAAQGEGAAPGLLRQLYHVLGGWPSATGLAAATLAGVWIGAFPPGDLESRLREAAGLSRTSPVIDIMPGTGLDLIGESSL